MKKFSLLLIALLCMSACGGGKDDDQHEALRQAAMTYYQYLVDGDVDSYMASMNEIDSLPEEYRSQLHDLFEQYLANEKEMRGGLAAAQVLRDTIVDGTKGTIFMEVTFGDSTKEQIAMPLVLTEQGWKIK